MAAIPTVEEEDAKRPLREREALTAEVTRLSNRMQSLLMLHGIRKFKVRQKKAEEKLFELKTACGGPSHSCAWRKSRSPRLTRNGINGSRRRRKPACTR